MLNGATPPDKADDGFTRATPDAIEEAWRLLFGQPMYDLLPNLSGLKAKGHWAAITAGAGPRGGTRWTNAVLAVDLKTKGSPITKDELRDLIDKLTDMFPDRRAAAESPRCSPHNGIAICRVARIALTASTSTTRVPSTGRWSRTTASRRAESARPAGSRAGRTGP